jgi:hypothetical protein
MVSSVTQKAAIKGASIYTVIGVSTTFLSHHLFPRFRSQTLALKAFIVSGFTIFGFVVGADTVLLNHEGVQRSEEDLIRNVARRELAKKGLIGSENEIERWKDETRERLLRERQAANLDEPSVTTTPSSE